MAIDNEGLGKTIGKPDHRKMMENGDFTSNNMEIFIDLFDVGKTMS